jgi:hypothetical protein
VLHTFHGAQGDTLLAAVARDDPHKARSTLDAWLVGRPDDAAAQDVDQSIGVLPSVRTFCKSGDCVSSYQWMVEQFDHWRTAALHCAMIQ